MIFYPLFSSNLAYTQFIAGVTTAVYTAQVLTGKHVIDSLIPLWLPTDHDRGKGTGRFSQQASQRLGTGHQAAEIHPGVVGVRLPI